MKLKKFKPYMAFARGTVLDGFAYKFGAFGWLLGDALLIVILYSLWYAIFQNSPSDEINGMTFPMMVTFLVYARITSTLTLNGSSFWILGNDIYEGNIAINLIKPVNYRLKLVAEAFGYFITTIILMFIPLMVIAHVAFYFLLGTPLPELQNLGFFAISVIFAMLIFDSFNFLIAQLIMYTNAFFGLYVAKNAFFAFVSGSVLPTAFFPVWLQTITNVLPFRTLVEIPTLILMGQYDTGEVLFHLGIQVIWVVVLLIISEGSFRLIRRRVVSVGG